MRHHRIGIRIGIDEKSERRAAVRGMRPEELAQCDAAIRFLDHYHFHHTPAGTTAFIAHEVDILVVSDPVIRARIRELLAKFTPDFPEPPARHGDETHEAYIPPIPERLANGGGGA